MNVNGGHYTSDYKGPYQLREHTDEVCFIPQKASNNPFEQYGSQQENIEK